MLFKLLPPHQAKVFQILQEENKALWAEIAVSRRRLKKLTLQIARLKD